MLSFDIQVQIIKRFPIKSLVQFRSVCKAWKSFIDSPDFINGYTTQSEHLVLKYQYKNEHRSRYISYVDDDTFPQQMAAINIPPQLTTILGSSHGLLCLADKSFNTQTVVLWNPAINKSVTISVPNNNDRRFEYVVGFGVCPDSKDPMLVKISSISDYRYIRGSHRCNPSQVMVFTLSSGKWTTRGDVFYNSNQFRSSHTVVGRFIYWVADSWVRLNPMVIISFDMTTQEFSSIYIPSYAELSDLRGIDIPEFVDSGPHESGFTVSRLRDSLVVVEEVIGLSICVVWRVDSNGSFTKLFHIHVPGLLFLRILGFSKSGKPIVQCDSGDDLCESVALLFDPCSEPLGIRGDGSFSVNSYRESLLLLNHVDGRIANW